MKRRTALAAAGVVSVGALAATTPALAKNLHDGKLPPKRQPFLSGADISSLPKAEDLGAVYRSANGRPGDAVAILAKAGVDAIRLKVWVDPGDGYNTSTQVVDLAARAKAAGMRVLVDFHYSDTWADPSKQYKPKAWEDLPLEDLKSALYHHTADVLGAMEERGAPADMVQVGNELNGGMLWPEGRWDQWDQLAQLLIAGHDAVKDTTPDAAVLLHLADGGDNGLYRWWFDEAESRGVPYDAIALSFYPYWHGGLEDLAANLADLAGRYGKPMYLVETAYPFTTEDKDGWDNIIGDAEPTPGYPATPEGQRAMLAAIAAVVKEAPDGLGRGLFWWEATWTGVDGHGWDPDDPSTGNGWENQALFDYDDKALPALKTLGRF
jgi:arabinogalactan endo-1,4-beta-galactosidase